MKNTYFVLFKTLDSAPPGQFAPLPYNLLTGSILSENKGAPLLLQNYGARHFADL